MSLQKCPECGQNSFIKTPGSRVVTERLGTQVHTADIYSFKCLNKECKHTTGDITVKTEFGKKLDKPWYKRIFS